MDEHTVQAACTVVVQSVGKTETRSDAIGELIHNAHSEEEEQKTENNGEQPFHVACDAGEIRLAAEMVTSSSRAVRDTNTVTRGF